MLNWFNIWERLTVALPLVVVDLCNCCVYVRSGGAYRAGKRVRKANG